jgi:oligoendopeptidase F
MTAPPPLPNYLQRSDVPLAHRWDLHPLFATTSAWDREFAAVREKMPELAAWQGKLGENEQVLFDFLLAYLGLAERLERLYAFAHLRSDEDIGIAANAARVDKMRRLYADFGATVAFFEPEIMALGRQRLEALLAASDDLQVYRHFFDNLLRLAAHTRNAEVEQLLALSGPMAGTPGDVFAKLNDVDFDFGMITDGDGKRYQLTHAFYGKAMQSADRILRHNAYTALHQAYAGLRSTLAANYQGMVNTHIFQARARNYNSTRAAALTPNAVSEEIYDNLVASVNDNLAPLHRYVSLRRRALRLEGQVMDYDLMAPLSPAPSRHFSWEEAQRLVVAAAAPLGDEYCQHLQGAFANGWIDVYENPGKRSGAYSSGAYGVHPYVLMNYNGTLNDVFTLAHEMGHAMHTFYAQLAQPYHYADYPIFLAEVASTTNEALLAAHMLEQVATPAEKLPLIDYVLTGFARTYYRQVIFAEFEQRSHALVERGEALSADQLESLFSEIYTIYHGSDFAIGDYTRYLWSRIPHFYYNYYVFQYATAFAAAQNIAGRLLKGESNTRQRYLAMLSGGSHDYPVPMLTAAGADLSTAAPFVATAAMMQSYLDALETSLAGVK